VSDQIIEARNFLDAMVPLLQATEQSEAMLGRRLGTVFRIADYSVGGYEVPLNKIIADLLDPRGPHGQGGTFLKLFLEQVARDLSSYHLQDWTVIASFRTRAGRYVDIALFNGQSVAVYIESKPWAEEGYQQLQAYAVDLVAQPHEQKWLLFLPGTADREPVTLTPEFRIDPRFKIISFQSFSEKPSIVRWLEQCAGACEADNVRIFIRDLAKYLDAEFPNNSERKSVSDDPFTMALLDTVLKNRHHIELVFRFERMAPELKRTVAHNFINELKRELEAKKPGWIVENEFEDFERRYQMLTIRKPLWPKNWGLGLSMWGPHFREFIIGFFCPSKQKHLQEEGLDLKTPLARPDELARIHEVLTNPLIAIGGKAGAIDEWWPAYCYLPTRPPLRNWDEAQTFLLLAGLEKMPDGSTALDKFVDWFNDLANAVEKCVDSRTLSHVRKTVSKK